MRHGSPHIVHVLQSFDIGGLEQLVLQLVEGAAARGIQSDVVAILEDGPMRERFEALGARTRVVPKRERVDPSVLPRLVRAIRELGGDVMHTHHLGPFLYGAPVARLLGMRHVHTEHSREFYNVPRRRLAGRWMSRLAETTCVSREIADWHAQNFGARPYVIVNGVTLTPPTEAARAVARRTLGLPLHTPVVGFVGRLAAEKAPADLVRALRIVRERHRDAVLVLVGEGPERTRVESVAHELGVDEAVRLLGRRSDVRALLPGFDVLGLSSLREGLPLAALEAMASAVPLVASAVGELPTLLEHGGGTCVAPRDVRGFARELSRLIANPVSARTEGERGYRHVQEHYSHEKMLDAYAARWRGAARADQLPVAA